MERDLLSIAKDSVRTGLRGVYPKATLRRDKTAEVITVEAMINDSNSASVVSEDRPFPGDVLTQSGHEWIVTEVGGWGDANLWELAIDNTQPEQAALAAPTITLRRTDSLLRVDFPNGMAGDEVVGRTYRENGMLTGPEFTNTLSGVDKQLVIPGVRDGWEVAIWYTRPPQERKSAVTRLAVPDAS